LYSLEDLNPEQRIAAETTEGPLLILAGAGSGKTRVLTYRIAHMIDALNVAPWNILAVTFTNKAAGEMRQRVVDLVGPVAERIWIGTFHSVCARLLRYEAEAFGLHRDFTIYDEEDRRALVRRILNARDLSDQDYPPRAVAGQISRAKNMMIDVETYARQSGADPHKRQIADVYADYEKGLRANKALDFDDLIVEPVRALRRCPEILEKYRQRFKYVLIDEYQDTNRPQYLLTRLLAEEHRNICVVGDDDQSIYQFRGADLRNILDFEKDYTETAIVRLEQNYRSTARILAAANAVIGNNLDRKGKKLWTADADGDMINYAECGGDRGEARHVVTKIEALCRDEGYSRGEAAILYRTNAQSRQLEEELRRGGIPYTIIGGLRFYERREIKDVLAYLRLLVNPDDDVSLLRVLNVPKRGIGNTTIERLVSYGRQQQRQLLDVIVHEREQVQGLGARAMKSLGEFAEIMEALLGAAAPGVMPLPELVEEVLEKSGYLEALRTEATPEAEAREENLGELVSSIAEYASEHGADDEDAGLSAFLEEVSLMTSEDEVDAEGRGQTLTLMTLHAAKGLEFPVIAICGLEEELFPTLRSIDESKTNPGAIEEERRLFYVGITRAQKHLLLASASSRYVFGQSRMMEPSRFVAEIPEHLVKVTQVESRTPSWGTPPGAARRQRWSSGDGKSSGGGSSKSGSSSSGSSSSSRAKHLSTAGYNAPAAKAPAGVHYEMDEGSAPDSNDPLAVGRWVKHPNFGRGMITEREGTGEDTKITVRFGSMSKRILVAYAQLEPA